MSKQRQEFSTEYRKQSRAAESMISIALGMVAMQWGNDFVQWAGGGLVFVGVYSYFPMIRPLAQKVVDRIPGLANKSEGGTSQ